MIPLRSALLVLTATFFSGVAGCAAPADDTDIGSEEQVAQTEDALVAGEENDPEGARILVRRQRTTFLNQRTLFSNALSHFQLTSGTPAWFIRGRATQCSGGCTAVGENGSWRATKDDRGRVFLRFTVRNGSGDVVRRDRYQYRWAADDELDMRAGTDGDWFHMDNVQLS